MSLRQYLDMLEGQEKLIKIKKKVSAKFEAAAIIKKLDPQPLLFENINGKRVVANVCGTHARIAKAFNTTTKELTKKIVKATKKPAKPKIVKSSSAKEIQPEKVNILKTLPVLTYYEKDAGPYITAAVLVSKSPETGIRNASVHRLLPIARDRFVLRLVPRHLYEYYKQAKDKGEPLDVGIVIGLDPATLFTACLSVPMNTDEFGVGSALLDRPLELVKCEEIDVEVPANAEFILEGRILPDETADEGPVGDITQTYDVKREQPIIQIEKITHRENPIYQAILPASSEHKILMGMPQEPSIYHSVQKTVDVVDVHLTLGGGSWLHGVISIKKKDEKDAAKAIMAAFDGHPSMKHVIIVDDDIDIHDLDDVEYALATRVQADRDIFIIPNVRGSTLDPSGSPEGTTTKMAIDATRPMDKPKSLFERIKIPNEDKIDLEKYLE